MAIKGDVRHLIALDTNQNNLRYIFGLVLPLGKKYSETIDPTVPVIINKPVKVQPIASNDNEEGKAINRRVLALVNQ